MNGDVLVRVEGVSKKFCRSLKRSLWYGVQDVSAEIFARKGQHDELRKNEFWAVNDVSFELKRGECMGLIGPNGAGKSTLLKMLNGLIKPDRGRISMRGRVGALIELGAGFNPILTARENIYVNGAVLGFSKSEVDRKFEGIVQFAEIENFIDMPVQNFSSGMKVRLGFAVAANMNPDILLIDEVLAVGDVKFRMKCNSHLLMLKENGTSIIVVSHAVNHLSRVTQRALVMNYGKLGFDGPLSNGVAEYERLLLPIDGDREENGSADTKIGDLKIKDISGHEKSDFQTGDTVIVEIVLKSLRKIDKARLIVAIESPSLGILGSFSTPYSKFDFLIEPPLTTIRLILPDLPLLVGAYFLNISLFGDEITDFFDRKAPGLSFQITGPETNEFGYGVTNTFAFRHKWKINDKCE